MFKKVAFPLIAACLFVGNVATFAQELQELEIKRPEIVKVPVSLFQSKLNLASNKIIIVNGIFDRMQTSKLLTAEDSKAFVNEMYAYAEAMKAAFDAAMGECEKAAKSQGKEGNVEWMKIFEDKVSKDYQTILKPMEVKITTMMQDFREGKVKLDKSMLQSMTLEERNEVRNLIHPKEVQRLEKALPNLMKPELFRDFQMKGLPERKGMRKPEKGTKLALDPSDDGIQGLSQLDDCNCEAKSPLAQISDFFIAPAEASTAWPCISPCWNKRWGECWSCISTKGSAAVNAWNEFVRCWNGCSWWQWWCKGWCLTTFIWKIG